MKILVISQYFYPENLRINDICFSLNDMGHDITVLTGKPNYPKGKFYKNYNFFSRSFELINKIKVYRANLIPRGPGNGIMLSLNYLSFLFFGFFKLISIKKKFDIVFVYAPSPITVGYIGIIASWLYKAKSFLWVHDLWPESVKVAGGINNTFILKILDFMTRSIYFFYKNILVQSPAFKTYLLKQSVPENKIKYYPYYAESFYKKVEEDIEIKNTLPEGLKIIFAGNIGVSQNFDTIIEAIIIAKQKYKDINIIILGDGRDKIRIKQKIKDYNLDSNFHFLGSFPPERMPYFFASADALLISLKKSEIFSLTIPGKLQSYLACGKPIIGSIDGIVATIIKDAKCGFVSPSESPAMLAKSIINFYNLSESEKEKMGKNSLRYYSKHFDKEILLNELIKKFNE